MKNLFFVFLAFLLVLTLFSVNSVSATADLAGGYTLVNGKITEASTGEPVVGANVSVICEHDGVSYVKYQNSFDGPINSLIGKYGVTFLTSECEEGDTVIVSASKDGLFGQVSGVVNSTRLEHLDLAVVNVPLVPEFGAIVGMITILGAVGIFFVVRRD